MAVDPAGFHGPVRAAGRARRRRVDPSRQVRVRVASTTSSRRATQGAVYGIEPRGGRGARRPGGGRPRRPARRRDRPRLRLHAGGGQRRPPPRLRQEGHPRRLPRLGRLRRGGRGGRAAPGRAGRAGRRARACSSPGPNGQGVVSTPARLCAQIVAPYPPAGGIGIASQSGNFISSFMNYAVQTGVGVSRAVSAGNAAAVTIPDYLDFYAADDATRVGLAYVEGVPDGRAFFERTRAVGGPQAARAREGRCHRRRSARRRVPHRLAGQRRPGVRRHVPSGRHHPGRARSRRRSRRRPPSPPSRSRRATASSCSPPPAAGGSSPPTRSRARRSTSRRCPTTCGPRSTPSCRRAGAATTRSTWPAPRPATRSPR